MNEKQIKETINANIDEITKAVLQDIQDIRITQEVGSDANLASIIKKIKLADDVKEQLRKELKNNKDTYVAHLALEKNNQVEQDYKNKLEELAKTLDPVLQRQVEMKNKIIQNNLSNNEYQAKRRDAINIIKYFGKDLEQDIVFELIKPLIEAKDILTLRVLQTASSRKNNIVYAEAIRKVENYISNQMLENTIKEAKEYIRSTSTNKSLAIHNLLYKAESK